MMIKRIAFKTLGCRLNQFETDSVATDFHSAGYEIVNFNEKAEVYVINTCTVTGQGDHKSKSAINHALRNSPDAVIVVTGCMAESRKDELEMLEGINYIVDNKRKGRIFDLVHSHFNGTASRVEDLTPDVFGFSAAVRGLHTRNLIKIQDGCDNFCTFCIVPHVRGRAVSRPSGDVLGNIRRVLDAGYREIVLTGVNISRYNDAGIGFESLIEKILGLEGLFRLRISSVEPDGFSKHFYHLFAHEKLCPHLHICLQSGSDRIISAMGRNYTLSAFMGMVNELKGRYPLFNLTTDIMVGFPGETDEDFRQTCNIIRDVGFSHVHTFKFSIRHGTKAERMSGQIPGRIITGRSRIIREISDANKMAYRRMLLDRKQVVLVEKTDHNGYARGYGEHYVPVAFLNQNAENNRFYRVMLQGIRKGSGDMIMEGVCEGGLR
ncbi:MAG: tRNA (N(6)-L-threonylcarbamoyladenosine(37)-C(2))-methylthiotransferase MtaB [Bacteroidales bacterium]|nr:tRNA (N(6)-L-threonylcarbamoyladenosine(37)-C(2))-methylthiotransferase MtaB [Bacteroidales bacterium]